MTRKRKCFLQGNRLYAHNSLAAAISWELSRRTFRAKIILAAVQVHRASLPIAITERSRKSLARYPSVQSYVQFSTWLPGFPASRFLLAIHGRSISPPRCKAPMHRFALAFSTKRNHSLKPGKKVGKPCD